MVISDPNATKAAAAMSVDVGAASDPVDLPGLAHFLEHMLFLGEKETGGGMLAGDTGFVSFSLTVVVEC